MLACYWQQWVEGIGESKSLQNCSRNWGRGRCKHWNNLWTFELGHKGEAAWKMGVTQTNWKPIKKFLKKNHLWSWFFTSFAQQKQSISCSQCDMQWKAATKPY